MNRPLAIPSRRAALAFLGAGAATLSLPVSPASAADPEKVTLLLPAPAVLVAFAPFQIAKKKGYYLQENIDLEITTVNGGVEAAKQVGLNNADVADGLGDGPIFVRPNGVPVRTVALLGGRSLHHIAYRNDRGISTLKDLKGKTITVLAYTDTSYYALLGNLAAVGLTKNDVSIQAVGPAAIMQLVIAGKADALIGPPEWVLAVAAQTPTTILWNDTSFQSMAQAILCSDETIAKRPAMVRGVVRATLRVIRDIMASPDTAAVDFVAAVPANQGQEATIKPVLAAYAQYVYPGQKKLGEVDVARLTAVANFYLKAGIVDKPVTIADLYTNQFV